MYFTACNSSIDFCITLSQRARRYAAKCVVKYAVDFEQVHFLLTNITSNICKHLWHTVNFASIIKVFRHTSYKTAIVRTSVLLQICKRLKMELCSLYPGGCVPLNISMEMKLLNTRKTKRRSIWQTHPAVLTVISIFKKLSVKASIFLKKNLLEVNCHNLVIHSFEISQITITSRNLGLYIMAVWSYL